MNLQILVVSLSCTAILASVSAQHNIKSEIATLSVDFNREIRPILANNCFQCHGADEKARQAGLRLDSYAGATAARNAGQVAIVPGKSAKSLLFERITAKQDALRMPPVASGKTLTPVQVDLLRRWIDQGAKYAVHWAFVAPRMPEVPSVSKSYSYSYSSSGRIPTGRSILRKVIDQSPSTTTRTRTSTIENWPRNPIDNFVLARLLKEGLKPSPEADKHTLCRRLYLDLIGLPPSPRELDDFANDKRPDAYERLVDKLLASPHYGERWARRWLDVARYADTNGYEKDRERSIWPYRDWVIKALNADMPFDQFTIKQLAGDLLPNPTPEDIIATGFHRNTMQNEEGGIDIAEDRFKQMVDRVNTTGAAWLGLTVMCTQCHNHKYDPLTQREFYGLYAYLNNTDEFDVDLPSDEIKLKRGGIQAQIDKVKAERIAAIPGGREKLRERTAEWARSQRAKATRWTVLKPGNVNSKFDATMDVLADNSVLASGNKPNTDTYTIPFMTTMKNITALRLEVLTDPSLPDGGPGRAHFFQRGGFLLSEVRVEAAKLQNGGVLATPVLLKEPSADFEAPGRSIAQTLDGKLDTGWMITGQEGKDHRAVFQFDKPVGFAEGTFLGVQLDQYFVHQCTLGRFRIAVTYQPNPVRAAPFPADAEEAICQSEDIRSGAEWKAIEREYLNLAPELAAFNQKIIELEKSLPQYTTTMVLKERPANHPRTTHLHQRGEFLKPMETVEPITPSVLPPVPAGYPKNRLGLARWLVSRGNPLTARVVVNREWQAFFGRGLVATVEDFGTRGEPPTHPELLDWLAMEFTQPRVEVWRYGSKGILAHLHTSAPPHLGTEQWSLKRLHRLIVTSSTYRQSARVTPELLAKDPINKLYARAPRFRVDAEMVRDSALAAAGLLDERFGGPSVFPPQPAEVTAQVYGGGGYTTSKGPDRYRRGLYTHFKRTAPFAAYITFDAPTSESTCLRRVKSNTPLQALTLMNDEVFVEAAEALAQRLLREGGPTTESRIDYLYRCVVSRSPKRAELDRIRAFFEDQWSRFKGNETEMAEVALKYRPNPPAGTDVAELAAWVLVCRAVMNLDEAVTKQ